MHTTRVPNLALPRVRGPHQQVLDADAERAVLVVARFVADHHARLQRRCDRVPARARIIAAPNQAQDSDFRGDRHKSMRIL